ncbi:MAG: L-serine ammonia-lyase, iron-sulfur-dependent, subunit beta, partial [Lachnospirales bacterium]
MKFDNIEEVIHYAIKENTTISSVVLKHTAILEEMTEEEIFENMSINLMVMEESIKKGSQKDVKSLSGLTGGNSYKFKEYMKNSIVSGDFIGHVIMASLAVSEINACMGKVVASPTAGSCGILPACLLTLEKHKNIPRE